MKPFKIRTMNSIYELDQVGLWQNGMLYMAAEDITMVGSIDKYWELDRSSIPCVGEMLYVVYLREGVSPRYIRTSLVKEIISNG